MVPSLRNKVFARAFYKKLVGVRGQRPCDTQQKHYINRLRLIVVSMLWCESTVSQRETWFSLKWSVARQCAGATLCATQAGCTQFQCIQQKNLPSGCRVLKLSLHTKPKREGQCFVFFSKQVLCSLPLRMSLRSILRKFDFKNWGQAQPGQKSSTG